MVDLDRVITNFMASRGVNSLDIELFRTWAFLSIAESLKVIAETAKADKGVEKNDEKR